MHFRMEDYLKSAKYACVHEGSKVLCFTPAHAAQSSQSLSPLQPAIFHVMRLSASASGGSKIEVTIFAGLQGTL
jgi:hypothetical protein